MIDLKTTYLGLDLKNPLVASPSPLCEEISNIRQMEDSGAAAVVLHSLFEEQITLESSQLDTSLEAGAESFAESLSYFPDMTSYNLGPEGYLEHVRKAKAAVDIPVIASLNGVSTEGWIKYAKKIEEAGADGLELNIYYLPTDPDMTAAEVEQVYYDLVAEVKTRLRIPLAVKIGPYFSSMGNAAQRLDELEVVPNLILSTPHELLLRLHWVAMIYGHIRADLALTGGVYTAEDVLKSMMAGARVAMMTSALLRYGIPHLEMVRRDLVEWMEKHEYESIHQMQGSMARKSVADPSAFGRANYMKMLSSYTPRAVSRK